MAPGFCVLPGARGAPSEICNTNSNDSNDQIAVPEVRPKIGEHPQWLISVSNRKAAGIEHAAGRPGCLPLRVVHPGTHAPLEGGNPWRLRVSEGLFRLS